MSEPGKGAGAKGVGGVGDPKSWPQPLPGRRVANHWAWMAGLAPVLYVVLLPIFFKRHGIFLDWILPFIVNSVLCGRDEAVLQRAGYDTTKLSGWSIFLVPVYLWKRARLLGQDPFSYVEKGLWRLTLVGSVIGAFFLIGGVAGAESAPQQAAAGALAAACAVVPYVLARAWSESKLGKQFPEGGTK